MKKKLSVCLLVSIIVILMAIPVYAYVERNRTDTYYDDANQYSIDVIGSLKEDVVTPITFKVVPKKDYVLVKNIKYPSSDFANIIHIEISRRNDFGANSMNNREIIASGSVSNCYASDSVKIDVGKNTTHKLKKGKRYYIRAYASQRLYNKDKSLWIECPNIETMTVKSFKAK